MKIIKRNGTLENYNSSKVKKAIKKSFKACKQKIAKEDLDEIVNLIDPQENENVESIQDKVEKLLIQKGYEAPAKEYILYRDKHAQVREWVEKKKKFIANYKASSNTANSTIDDNSNVANKNIAILNTEIHKADNIQISRRMIMDKLAKIFPDFKSKQYVKDLEDHIIYKHDESSFAGAIAPYCCSISMYPFLLDGIKNIGGLSAAPKNLDSFCGMYCNLIFATSAMFAGAVATCEFLLYFDYFCRKEWGDDYIDHIDEFRQYGKDVLKLQQKAKKNVLITSIEDIKKLQESSDEEVKELADKLVDSFHDGKCIDETRTIRSIIHQHFQQVIYTINQPAAARGFQAAFVNFSYYDKPYFDSMFDGFMFPDESKPIWRTLNWIQKDFMMWFNDERLKTIITFPVESFAMIYKDGEFVDKENAEFVAQEYARGHSFFTYISDTADSLSSCCRLKNKVTTHQFSFTNGNCGIETGSKSVITTNLNRIVQDYTKETKQERSLAGFKAGFKEYFSKILERIYKYQIAYNELLWDMYDANLLPVYKAGFISLDKQYLTIGINGLNQAAEFLGIKCNKNDDYKEFCQFVFSIIKDCNTAHNGKFNNHKIMFNTECVPAESLAVKNYNWDKEDGYWVDPDDTLYASYIFKPNDEEISVLDKFVLHGNDYIGDFLDGGSAAHINLDHHLDVEQYRKLLKFAGDVGCQYFTFNIPNSQCADCGYITKQPITKCPKCGSIHIDYYDRVIGYLTKIKNWSDGRRLEKRVYNGEHENMIRDHDKVEIKEKK